MRRDFIGRIILVKNASPKKEETNTTARDGTPINGPDECLSTHIIIIVGINPKNLTKWTIRPSCQTDSNVMCCTVHELVILFYFGYYDFFQNRSETWGSSISIRLTVQ